MYTLLMKSLNIKFHTMALSAICVLILLPNSALAADHGDAPITYRETLKADQFNITDVYAFIRKNKLVLVLATNPRISASAKTYIFPENVEYNIEIDTGRKGYTSVYTPYINPNKITQSYYNKYGGKIVYPNEVSPRFQFSITFDSNNKIRVTESAILDTNNGTLTYPLRSAKPAKIFYGLRDDPFIRTGREGKNVAAIVIEYPLRKFTKSSRYLMIWASTRLREGSDITLYGDTAGRSFRSMFPNTIYPTTEKYGTVNILNYVSPSEQSKQWHLIPDVMILDTKRKSGFPNGRELTDDIVKVACLAGGLEDTSEMDICRPYDAEGRYPGTKTNDVPFLKKFPYLAEPHLMH